MINIKEFFDRQKWIFAKTYADKAPHEYILRHKMNGNDEEFEQAVVYIREHGFKAKFWGNEYTYLNLDGHLYWTMGDPVNETIVLNRCNVDDYELHMRRKKANDLQGE